MALDLNKKNIKRIMLLIAFAALLYWGLNNLKWISGVLGSLLDLLSPLLIGICIAFVLNLMMAALERLWDRALAKWGSPWNAKLKRPVCLPLTLCCSWVSFLLSSSSLSPVWRRPALLW